MVAKISIGSSLYGVLAYNAQKVNAGEGKLLAVNGVFDACTGKIDLARTVRCQTKVHNCKYSYLL